MEEKEIIKEVLNEILEKVVKSNSVNRLRIQAPSHESSKPWSGSSDEKEAPEYVSYSECGVFRIPRRGIPPPRIPEKLRDLDMSSELYLNEEDEKQKGVYLKKHIESIRKHIKELSDKKYESLYEINSPDYVLMFVPIEPAYLLALSNNNQLYLEALDKNVVLVSTSTLLATLSTVSSMWRQENQKKNVLEIANQAGRLYDQFVNLTDDLIKVGNQLKTVQGSYDTSMKKHTCKGNLIKKVEKIKELGAKTSKIMNKNLLDRASEN